VVSHYGQASFVLISISLDEDMSALKRMVAAKGMDWQQICDGKGSTELVRLFNATTPTYYLLDRDGRIQAKHMGALGLEKIIGTVSTLVQGSTSATKEAPKTQNDATRAADMGVR
jgi:hypothetical protein